MRKLPFQVVTDICINMYISTDQLPFSTGCASGVPGAPTETAPHNNWISGTGQSSLVDSIANSILKVCHHVVWMTCLKQHHFHFNQVNVAVMMTGDMNMKK